MNQAVYALLPDQDLQSAHITRRADGAYVCEWVFVEALMSADDRAACAAFDALYADFEPPEGNEPPAPAFACFADALAYATAVNWGVCISYELAAYHAPSECGERAYAAQSRAFEAALDKAISS